MPYMWLKPEEAELIIRRRKAEIPDRHAFFDNDKNAYICDDCHTYTLTEIDGTPNLNGMTYTPILQCSECGRTYFGNDTYYQVEEPQRPVIKKPERREQSPKQEEEYIILPSIKTV